MESWDGVVESRLETSLGIVGSRFVWAHVEMWRPQRIK